VLAPARRWLKRAVLGLLLAFAGPHTATADQLKAEWHSAADDGHSPIEELSYETIIEASDGYHAELRVRVALHNTSAVQRDAVLSLALPKNSELVGVAVGRDGHWFDGRATTLAKEPGRRDPGTVFVSPMAPESHGDLPGADVVAFSMESGATLQVELRLRVYPALRGDRWRLELPSRSPCGEALSSERRVLVHGLGADEEFWVDDRGNAGKPFVLTPPEESVMVAWPARVRRRSVFDARYEVTARSGGGSPGGFRLYLSLGQSPARRPDHVVVVVDRSRSTSPRLQRETARMLAGLFDALPSRTTFEVIGFARRATRLLGEKAGDAPSVHDADARQQLERILDANLREQGTDIETALQLTGAAVRARRARRPMILIVTDGMLPASLEPVAVRKSFEKALGARKAPRHGRRPEIVFLVDDPLLAHTGLTHDHSIARVAAALGARISLKTLSQLQSSSSMQVLDSPRVLGQLHVSLPRNMKLSTPPPPGLVAGNFVVLHGTYRGRPASRIAVKGRVGNRPVVQRARATARPPLPEALVALPGTKEQLAATRAVQEGFSHPPWYTQADRRTAQRGITQAGRGPSSQKGRLNRSIFSYYLRTRVLPRARVCYNHAISRNHVQAGRIALEMEVGKGEVMAARTADVKLDHADPKLVACLTEAAWALDIPAGKLDDRLYLVRYPLRLSPPEGGTPPRVGDPLGEGTVDLLLHIAPSGG
jgi:Mg-chelatase subunit ChlD